MVAVSLADERTSDPERRAVDAEVVARAFRSLLADGARIRTSSCLSAGDKARSPFGAALIGHIFVCEPPAWAVEAAGERLAASFAAVARAPGAGDGDQAPLAQAFSWYGLPETVVAADVVEPLPEAPQVANDELPDAGAPLEVARLSRSDGAVALAPAPLAVAVPALSPEQPAVTEAPPAIGQVAEAAVSAALAPVPPEAETLTGLGPEEHAAEEQATVPPLASLQPPGAVVEAREIERAEIREPRAGRKAETASRRNGSKARAAVAAAKRRATRTVSVSRSVALPKSRTVAGRVTRLRDQPVAPAPATRPPARSFSPKMSSAGPAQPAPRP